MKNAERSAPWSRIPLERFGLASANAAMDKVATGHAIKALIDPRLLG
jgi:hypothetical protein